MRNPFEIQASRASSEHRRFGRLAQGMRPLLVVLGLCSALCVNAQNGPDADVDSAQGYINNVFHHGQIDSVSLYNGQLTIPLALGPSYPIGPKLKFQLLLTYNSRVWEYGHPSFPEPTLTYTPLAGDSALGMGWTMTLGKITTVCKYGPCYEAPDGSEHHFNYSGTKTSDGSQFSLHFIDSTHGYEMWDGDGNHYEFGWQVLGFDDALTSYVKDFGRGRDGWYLTKLTDPFGNFVSVTYPTGSAPCWTYTGSTCSTTKMKCTGTTTNLWTPSTISFSGGGSITINRDSSSHIVSSIDFNSIPVNGVSTPVTYTFTLATESYTTHCSGPNSLPVTLEEIDTVSFPGGSYNFDYSGGYLTKVTLPTLGEISYTYGTWSFFHGRVELLSTNCTALGPPPGISVIVSPDIPFAPNSLGPYISGHPCNPDEPTRYVDAQNGVVSRTEKVSSGGAAATTTYTHYAYPYGETGSSPPTSPGGQGLTVVVYPPNADNVTMAKAVLFWNSPHNVNATPLPGDRTGGDLEERIFDHDPNTAGTPSMPVCGGGSDASICSSFAARVKTRTFHYGDDAVELGNRRLGSETTCYGSRTAAGTCNTGKTHAVTFTNSSTCGTGGTSLCDWDLDNGRHYNIETHSGNLGNDAKVINTKWTPSASPWLPNIFNERVTTLSGYTRDELFEFDSTGFQLTRAIWDGPVSGPGAGNAWLQCRYPSGGNAVNEFTATYIGVTAQKPPTNVCTYVYPQGWSQVLSLSPFGSSGAFGKQRTFSRGQLLTSQWMDAVVQSVGPPPTYAQLPLSWYAAKYSRDSVTGWVTTSYDTGGQATPYKYDELGRVTSISPPNETSISVSYDSATQTTVTRGSLTWERYLYDGLGRLVREIRQTGSSAYAVRTHTFDLAGHESATSEWASCTASGGDCLSAAPAGTTRSSFDPFDRPRLIVGPSNATYSAIDRTDGTVTYSDTREATTTCVNGAYTGSGCASGSITSQTQRYMDAFGRVTKVTEPGGLGDTTYAYDVNDKLRSVTQGGRNRTFTYDGFGYLLSESTPEKGTVTYTDATHYYGGIGNSTIKIEGTGGGQRTHTFSYDGAGRLTRDVFGSTQYALNCYDGNGTTATSLCDDGATQNFNGGSASGGKLTRRVGANPLFTPVYPSTAATEVVREDMAYAGLGGRLSDRTTTMLDSGAHTVGGVTGALEHWGYNSLGLVNDHVHPRVRGLFDEALSYSYGRLSSLTVSGYDFDSTAIPGITVTPTFRAAGNLGSYTSNQVGRANSLVTIIYQDFSGIPRPRQIQAGLSSSPPYLFDTGNIAYDAAGNITGMGTDTFAYDAVSRITSANYGSSQSYSYDRWGNLMTKGGTTFCDASFPCANNQVPLHYGGSYDTRGNLVSFGGESLTYDDSNRQSKDVNGGVTWQYLFAGADERAVRVPASGGLSVARREIARYIVQGKLWAPATTACSEGSLTFGDVHCMDPDWGYIQKVYTQGLTGGCLGGTPPNYCPDNAVTRGEAAVLFMKAEHGSSDNPSCAGLYVDNPCSDPKSGFVEQAIAEGVLAICSSGHACPANALTELDAAKGMSDSNLWNSYKPISGGSLYTLRNTENQLVTEFVDSLASRDNIYIGNVVVASYLSKQPSGSGSWQFHASDHLGTVRLTVDGATVGSGFLEAAKYWPFGDRLTPLNVPQQRIGFAAMEKDSENTHFYDHARNHDSNLGRFTTTDSVRSRIGDPQTWNRYSYSRNNPMLMVDRNGLCSQPAGVGGDWIGFCAEAFIAKSRFNLIALGDGRGQAADNPNLTSRVQVQWLTNAKTGETRVLPPAIGTSRVDLGLVEVGIKGSASVSVRDVFHVDGSAGSATGVAVRIQALNGFSWAWPLAPRDSIQLNLDLVVGSDGQVTLTGSRTAYPTIGVWEYQAGHPPQALAGPEESATEDGLSQMVPIEPCFAGRTMDNKPCAH